MFRFSCLIIFTVTRKIWGILAYQLVSGHSIKLLMNKNFNYCGLRKVLIIKHEKSLGKSMHLIHFKIRVNFASNGKKWNHAIIKTMPKKAYLHIIIPEK